MKNYLQNRYITPVLTAPGSQVYKERLWYRRCKRGKGHKEHLVPCGNLPSHFFVIVRHVTLVTDKSRLQRLIIPTLHVRTGVADLRTTFTWIPLLPRVQITTTVAPLTKTCVTSLQHIPVNPSNNDCQSFRPLTEIYCNCQFLPQTHCRVWKVHSLAGWFGTAQSTGDPGPGLKV